MKLWNDDDTVVVTEAGELLRKASEAIKRVRELHKPVPRNEFINDGDIVCQSCVTWDNSGCSMFVFYPCETIKALDGEQE